MTKTALLIDMIDRLRSRPGITIAELAGSLGRSERTIYRWLNELTADVGVPVYCRGGGYYLAREHSPGLQLTAEELLATRLGLKSAAFAPGSPLCEQAGAAWRKIRQAASPEALAATQIAGDGYSLHITAPEGTMDGAVSAELEKAIAGRKRLRVSYRSQKSNEVKEYVIDPYAMVFRRHSWYLLAHCHEHGRIAQFKLVRFRRVEQTGHCFRVPEDFSADGYFGSSWEAWGGGEPTTVRVKFTPRVAAMIAETRRHPTQQTTLQPDGSAIFEVTVSGIEEIGIWVMGYGGEAEVLDPPELRDYVATQVRGMARTYLGYNDQ